MPHFMVRWPDGKSSSVSLEEEDLFIGRVSTINDLCIEDPSISRQHAHIKKREEGYTIYDLKSLNGVVVNGEKVSRVLLKDGDVVQLGDVEITVGLRPSTTEEQLAAIESCERTQRGVRVAPESDEDEVTRRSKISSFAGTIAGEEPKK